jgi:hypothetical protein
MIDEEFENMTYDQVVKLTLKELEDIEHVKKKRIIILAKKLESLGTPKEMISQQISRDLQGLVNSSYVRLCLGEAYKDKQKVREQTTSQSRVSASANEDKKVLISTINDGKQETINQLQTPKEEESVRREIDPPLLSNDSTTIESLQDKLKAAEQHRDYLAAKLSKKSPEFSELYEELKELKEIESKRIRHNDFKIPPSLPVNNQQQQKIESLEKRINEQDTLLAKTRFEAELEPKRPGNPTSHTYRQSHGQGNR